MFQSPVCVFQATTSKPPLDQSCQARIKVPFNYRLSRSTAILHSSTFTRVSIKLPYIPRLHFLLTVVGVQPKVKSESEEKESGEGSRSIPLYYTPRHILSIVKQHTRRDRTRQDRPRSFACVNSSRPT